MRRFTVFFFNFFVYLWLLLFFVLFWENKKNRLCRPGIAIDYGRFEPERFQAPPYD